MSWLRRSKNEQIRDGSDAEYREPTLAAAEPAPAAHVGVLMRECREHYGEDLRAVAQTLRIRLAYLQAIEQGQFEALPGATYAVGFIRAYADYLGLDSDAILQTFRAGTSDMRSRSDLDFPVAPAEGKFPSAMTMWVSLVLVVATIVGWQYFSESDDSLAMIAAVAPAGDAALSVRMPAPPAADDAALIPPADDHAADLAAVSAASTIAAAADFPGSIDDDVGAVLPTVAAAAAVPEPVGDDARADGAILLAVNVPIESPLDAPVRDPAAAALGEALEANRNSLSAAISPAIEAPDATPSPDVAVAALPADPLADPQPTVLGAGAESPALALVEPFAGNAVEAPDILETELPLPPIAAVRLSADPRREADAEEGRIYGMPNRNARIIIGAESDSWVQIRDQSQTDVFTRLLRAGDQYRVPNRDGLTLLTGNAGGLWITIDGKNAPPIGELGEVARDVPLIPDQLKAGATAVN